MERYLHIQKMRFGRRLTYEISLEPCILEEEIPKLILQPFVENAIVHGFESAEGIYTLSVTGREEEENMVFCGPSEDVSKIQSNQNKIRSPVKDPGFKHPIDYLRVGKRVRPFM